ncbi:MAG: hypothetical protein M1347_05145 [Chloroflexi bacterium]|nr:hypothetical protein [Chloroflexota bacterium]
METANYLFLGFAVIFGVLFLHLASFFLRGRNLRRDLQMLEQLEKHSARKTAAKKKKTSRR